jgi:sigma-B regulation protein RsbU (phosphoserine phosphatase)
MPQSARAPRPLSRWKRHALTDLRQAFQPQTPLDCSPCQVAWWSRPAEAVGGDLVVVHPLPDGRRFLFVADVMGHGTPAAIVASGVRALLHLHLDAGPCRPGDLLARLARSIHALYAGYFVTATACVLDPTTGLLTYAQAGHPPLLACSTDGVCQLSLPSLPLGVLPGERYAEETHLLEPGSTVLIHTDGVTDALSEVPGAGLSALADLLRQHPAEADEQVRAVRRAVRASGQASDDCTVLAVALLRAA